MNRTIVQNRFDLTIVKKPYFPSYHTAAVLCCCAKLAFQKNNGEIAEATVGRTRLMIGTTRCKNEHYAFMKTLKLSVKNTKRWLTTDLWDKHIFSWNMKYRSYFYIVYTKSDELFLCLTFWGDALSVRAIWTFCGLVDRIYFVYFWFGLVVGKGFV